MARIALHHRKTGAHRGFRPLEQLQELSFVEKEHAREVVFSVLAAALFHQLEKIIRPKILRCRAAVDELKDHGD